MVTDLEKGQKEGSLIWLNRKQKKTSTRWPTKGRHTIPRYQILLVIGQVWFPLARLACLPNKTKPSCKKPNRKGEIWRWGRRGPTKTRWGIWQRGCRRRGRTRIRWGRPSPWRPRRCGAPWSAPPSPWKPRAASASAPSSLSTFLSPRVPFSQRAEDRGNGEGTPKATATRSEIDPIRFPRIDIDGSRVSCAAVLDERERERGRDVRSRLTWKRSYTTKLYDFDWTPI